MQKGVVVLRWIAAGLAVVLAVQMLGPVVAGGSGHAEVAGEARPLEARVIRLGDADA